MIVDTSVLVALIDPRDGHHKKARAQFEVYGPQDVPQPVFGEFLQVVEFASRRNDGGAAGRKAARSALDVVTRVLRFHVAPVQNWGEAVELYEENGTLSFADACGVAEAVHVDDLWTMDLRQARVLKSRLGKADRSR